MAWLFRGSAEKARARENLARAGEIGRTLDLALLRDERGIYHGTLQRGGQQFSLAVGSAVTRKGMQYVLHPFVDLRAERPTLTPDAWSVRPPRRTHFEWHDGMPGEAPNFAVAQRALVLEGFIDDETRGRIVRWLEGLPREVWLHHLTPGEVHLRTDYGQRAREAEQVEWMLGWAAEGLELGTTV
jgi:hypothetical protein